ncbi:1252_t:CDS:2, partial [Racocetra persica]
YCRIRKYEKMKIARAVIPEEILLEKDGNLVINKYTIGSRKYSIGISEVERLAGYISRQQKQCIGFLVTTIGYTEEAKNEAFKSKVSLCFRDNILQRIRYRVVHETIKELKRKTDNKSNDR